MISMLDIRRGLYPATEPFRTGRLRVSDLHELHFEECGNPTGRPALVLHGGPGGAIAPYMRQGHDPAKYRIILFDQRGCGKSTPFASTEENTTWHLVADMEALRVHLGIERWQIVGGSWGSTLALAYAESFPDRVNGLILRGIFTVTRAEVQWFYQFGASAIFPEEFAAFQAPIPVEERGDMIEAYYRRLTGADFEQRRVCARAWSRWEGATASLLPNTAQVNAFEADDFSASLAMIECHYFRNGGFFEKDGWLLDHADRIRHIPGVLIQGRYDMVTPMFALDALSRKWPEAHLEIIPDAGHIGTEPGIAAAMVRSTDRFATLPLRPTTEANPARALCNQQRKETK